MIEDKLKSFETVLEELSLHRAEGKKIVFTNGCFDILHAGHAMYLEAAKAEGDILVVGINSDESVRRLKGKSRPVIRLDDRMTMLAALESTDHIISFDDDTPLELIKALQPDVLVKGGDWNLNSIVGADIVTKRGGKVSNIYFKEGISTSMIIKKIVKGARFEF
ncbi:MAG TPA: D-glycero-beta-D-manno-heptose 1-phosphate adenylyltransferase [Candidatus Cloacimonadota bacterium]|nr:D-glycero-beta-D-manno-heptose 1-phosphate adenylyltransferase [Candidatus Cloacimonadota bacterium]HPS38185.1 D-glycero-beta-D-manno-heptose 1-phosphate adenylyltransferase [Candidatus Cloacimonadota bacterium]